MAILGTTKTFSLFETQKFEKRPISFLEKLIYEKVNEERIRYNLPRLEWTSDVADVARKHSEDMGIKGYFAHENQEKEMVSERLERNGIVFTVSAENLFKCENYPDVVEEAVEGWMESPGHRENILNTEVTETGVGIYKVEGKNGYYITQNFIKRALKFIPYPSKLSEKEINKIFNIVKRTIEKPNYNYRNLPLKDRIYREFMSFGIPVKEDFTIEGFLKETPAIKMKVDLVVNNGFIINFTNAKLEDYKELFSKLINLQGYSAVVLVHNDEKRIEYLLIKTEEPK